MSGTLGIGVPVPKMLPVTGTWTLPFATYFLYLTNRIVYDRLHYRKYFGDRLTAEGHSKDSPDPLNLDVRCQCMLTLFSSPPLSTPIPIGSIHIYVSGGS